MLSFDLIGVGAPTGLLPQRINISARKSSSEHDANLCRMAILHFDRFLYK
jgi:hypothetical protein